MNRRFEFLYGKYSRFYSGTSGRGDGKADHYKTVIADGTVWVERVNRRNRSNPDTDKIIRLPAKAAYVVFLVVWPHLLHIATPNKVMGKGGRIFKIEDIRDRYYPGESSAS